MTNKTAYLHDENLLTLLSLNRFVVPEIQREYVWGNAANKDRVLRPFLEDLKAKAAPQSCGYAHGNNNWHIGFLYSYRPPYNQGSTDDIADEYLIDGQQRFTTLFLLLLSRAVREDRLVDFANLIRWEDENNGGNMAFDYKVREKTHNFLVELISRVINDHEDNNSLTLEAIVKGVKDANEFPVWFLKDYQQDTTISSMAGAMAVMDEVFNDGTETFYFDWLLTRIHFWHFKTDATSQGEELYITMNSRGEELTDNEAQKAELLNTVDRKQWGGRWEDWQTYFWRNRKEGGSHNINADKGFDNMTGCLAAMCEKCGLAYTIEEVGRCVDAIKLVTDTDHWEKVLGAECPQPYTAWLVSFKDDVWRRLNNSNISWKIEKESDTTQMQNAVLLWPWMYYYSVIVSRGLKVDEAILVRLIHLCYMNGRMQKTNYAGIFDFIDEIVNLQEAASWQWPFVLSNLDAAKGKQHKYISDEDIFLSQIYDVEAGQDAAKAHALESEVWKTQDLPYFPKPDVGDTTVMDFIKMYNNKHLDLLTSIQTLYGNLQTIFGEPRLLKELLLFYKDSNGQPFWKRTSPYYNWNYETSSWERIVRTENFRLFYNELTQCTNKIAVADMKDLLEKKREEFFKEPRNQEFSGGWSDRRLAILYDVVTEYEKEDKEVVRLWSDDSKPDLAFWDRDNETDPSIIQLYPSRHTIKHRKCGTRKAQDPVFLPIDWKDVLKNKYPDIPFK